MMTEKYIKAVAEGKAADLFAKQREIVSRHYSGGTGRLVSALSSVPVMQGRRLSIQYPLYIRFLDLSRTANDKRKKNYHPIYNKYTYGYLFSGIYRRLIQGFSGTVRQTLSQVFDQDTPLQV